MNSQVKGVLVGVKVKEESKSDWITWNVDEAPYPEYKYDEKDVPDFSGLFPKQGEWRKVPKGASVFEKNKYLRWYPYDTIDIYRVLEVYEVTDPCIQHAVKKLLCAGKRGYKEVEKDVQESIQSLQRWEEMRREELTGS